MFSGDGMKQRHVERQSRPAHLSNSKLEQTIKNIQEAVSITLSKNKPNEPQVLAMFASQLWILSSILTVWPTGSLRPVVRRIVRNKNENGRICEHGCILFTDCLQWILDNMSCLTVC